MKYYFENNRINEQGMTLIEVMIFIALISMMMTGFMSYVYEIHFSNIKLLHDIEDQYK